MRRIDLISATGMMALIIFVAVATRDMAFWRGVSPGPRFMPLLLVGTGSLLAIALFLKAWRSSGDTEAVQWPDRAGLLRVASFYLAAIGYGLVGAVLGFLTASVLFLLFTMIVVLRCPILPSLITTAITTTIIYLIFIGWLSIRLPLGPFGF